MNISFNRTFIKEIFEILRDVATERWFHSEEIFLILQLFDRYCDELEVDGIDLFGFNVNSKGPIDPKNGDLFIFSKITKVLKDDGVNWQKKKSANGIQAYQQTYQNIKIDGFEILSGIYSRSADNQRFYRFKNGKSNISLVHYRECSDEKIEGSNKKYALNPTIKIYFQDAYNTFNSSKISPDKFKSTNEQTSSYNIQHPQQQQQLPSIFNIPAPSMIQKANFQSNFNNNNNNNINNTSFVPQPFSGNYFQSQDVKINDSVLQQQNNFDNNNQNGDIQDISELDPELMDQLFGQPSLHNNNNSTPSGFYHNQFYSNHSFLSTDTINNNSINNNNNNYNPFYGNESEQATNNNNNQIYNMEVETNQSSILYNDINKGASFYFNNNTNNSLSSIQSQRFNTSVSIIDFSPSKDIEIGGTKILICLGTELQKHNSYEPYHVYFGNNCVIAELITSSVLRCFSPPNYCGNYFIWIADAQKRKISTPAVELFKYESNSLENPIINKEMLNTSNINHNKHPRSPREMNGQFNFDRENKIRIVEKLGNVQSALIQVNSLQDPFKSIIPINSDVSISPIDKNNILNLSLPVSAGDDEWLDDNQLSNLSASEIEELMDKYTISVVNQLVQLASVDDDLKTEIDSIDSNGFSLLHYCCMYNLQSLIPVLLARGATISRKTDSGSTSLHLALLSGHIDVVKLLIESGVDIFERDSNDLLASDIALEKGYNDIYNILISMSGENSQFNNYVKVNNSNSLDNSLESTISDISPMKQQNLVLSPHSIKRDSFTDKDLRSTKLLQEAFSTLSLTDKCAFSLSLGQKTGLNTPPYLNQSNDFEPFIIIKKTTSFSSNLGESNDIDYDMQSVLSETDKESLDAAMSMMGQSELNQVEDEVRKIQNNVRGWLLRKNYTNLRDAAKVLQVAWREKRRSNQAALIDSNKTIITIGGERKLDINKVDSIIDNNNISNDEMERKLQAAATLQAHTRGMIARKSFSSVRKQAMATIIIQKNLVKWLAANRELNQNNQSTGSRIF